MFKHNRMQLFRQMLALLCLVSAVPQGQAQTAATLATRGGGKVIACQTCHGAQGEGQAAAGFPRLAGQPAGYLYKQLREFSQGRRSNAQMQPVASALSDAQMRSLADYYAALPGWRATPAPPGTPVTSAASSQALALGERLATRGNWPNGVPACAACHGPGATGVAPHFPALAGQPAAYTRAQLRAFRSGTRSNDPQGLMKSVAEHLNDADIEAISTYYANPTDPDRRP